LGFTAAAVVFFCGLAGVAVLRGAALAGAAFLEAGVAGFLRAVVAAFACLFFEETGLPELVALRAGALSAEERFTIGFGFADLPASERFFDEETVEVWREVGREGDLFTPLTIGSLMRSPRLLKGRPNHSGRPKKLPTA
jgi:hypothetical protein